MNKKRYGMIWSDERRLMKCIGFIEKILIVWYWLIRYVQLLPLVLFHFSCLAIHLSSFAYINGVWILASYLQSKRKKT